MTKKEQYEKNIENARADLDKVIVPIFQKHNLTVSGALAILLEIATRISKHITDSEAKFLTEDEKN